LNKGFVIQNQFIGLPQIRQIEVNVEAGNEDVISQIVRKHIGTTKAPNAAHP
jgi:hypothetical protein